MPPFVVAMVPTLNGKVVVHEDQPMYLIKPKQVEAFKAKWNGMPEGFEYVAIEDVMDLRGPFPRPMP